MNKITIELENGQILNFELEDFNLSIEPQMIEEGKQNPTVDKITTKLVGNTISIYGVLKKESE